MDRNQSGLCHSSNTLEWTPPRWEEVARRGDHNGSSEIVIGAAEDTIGDLARRWWQWKEIRAVGGDHGGPVLEKAIVHKIGAEALQSEPPRRSTAEEVSDRQRSLCDSPPISSHFNRRSRRRSVESAISDWRRKEERSDQVAGGKRERNRGRERKRRGLLCVWEREGREKKPSLRQSGEEKSESREREGGGEKEFVAWVWEVRERAWLGKRERNLKNTFKLSNNIAITVFVAKLFKLR